METKSNNHPIYHNQSIFVYIVALVVAWLLGQQVITEAASLFSSNIWAYSIGSILGGYIFSVIFYELGKLIFGKIAGYRLVKINIFGFTWTKTKNGLKFKIGGLEGFGGRTLMAPKSDKAKPYLYLLGGTLFSIIIAGALIGLGFYLSSSIANFESVLYIAFLVCIVSLLIIILNLAPVLNDEVYDGFIIRLLATSVTTKEVYHHLLLQEDALITGRGELSVLECDYYNPLNSRVLLYNCYYYMDNGETSKAKETIKNALGLQDYLMEQDLGLFYSFHYYYLLMNEVNEKITDEYWGLEKSVRKVATSDRRFDTIKTALLVSAFIELSYDSYEYITTQIEKLKKSYSPLRVKKEDLLIEKALKEIERRKPEWFKVYDSEEE